MANNDKATVVPFSIQVEPLKHAQAVRINALCGGVLSAHIVIPIAGVPQLKFALDRALEQVPRVQLTGENPEPPPGNVAGNN